MNDNTTERKYLERELNRYFPNATVKVTFNDDETITATFNDDDCFMTYTMQVGSDDDYFDFISPQGSHITVPFHHTY